MNTPKLIVVLALVFALAMPATPVSAAPSASITLTMPIPDPIEVGKEVSFALIIEVGEIIPGVAGADIYLAYDDKLVMPPASPTGAVEPLPDFFGSSNITWHEILKPCQLPDGTSNPSSCIHLVAAGPAQVTQSGAVARFHFLGKAEGVACFKVLASALKNADGYSVDHTSASPVCGTVKGYTSGKVLRQGTPAEAPNTGGGTLACSVVWSTSGAITYGPVFTNDKGDFKLSSLPGGAHTLHAEYPGYLASEKAITLPPNNDVGATTLRGGDVNGDKKINILDIGTIIGKFGSAGVTVKSDPPDCTDPDDPTDINDDGKVNISDLAIAAGNWGLVGPTPWQP